MCTQHIQYRYIASHVFKAPNIKHIFHQCPVSPTGRPKLMAEMLGSGAFKTSPSDSDAAELPSCLKELTVDLNDACA